MQFQLQSEHFHKSELTIFSMSCLVAYRPHLLSCSSIIAAEESSAELLREARKRIDQVERERDEACAREQELAARLNDLSNTENELRDKVMASEVEYSGKLKVAAAREKELTDIVEQLQKRLAALQLDFEGRQQELQSKLDLAHEESAAVLRKSVSFNNSLSDAAVPANNSSSESPLPLHSSSPNKTHSHWQMEVESLRTVLDMKKTEIFELRRVNQELQRTADELSAIHVKCGGLESKVEDLQFQLAAKTEHER